MRISSRGEYGVRAMFDLAQRYGEGPISLKLIAERQDISDHYLEQLMGTLRKSGLVTSIRGAQGGYELASHPDTISIGDIIRALEGPILTVHGKESEKDRSRSPESAEQLALSHTWERLAEQVSDVLNSVSLSDLVEEAARMKAQDDSFMYHI